MARLIFAAQRDASGGAIFAQQVESATLDISASLTSQGSVQASLSFVPQFFAANLTSQSGVNATLQLIDVRMSVALVSQGSLSADLQQLSTNITAALSSQSSISATLRISEPILLAANLASNSTIQATLFFSGGSLIPKSAKLRAIPVGSDSAQLIRYRGDTYADQFVVIDDRTGLPVDLTGCVLKLSIAESDCGGIKLPPVYTLFGSFDNITQGEVSFAPTEDQADRVGFYKYDVEMDDGKGVVRTLVKNSYVYQQDITP